MATNNFYGTVNNITVNVAALPAMAEEAAAPPPAATAAAKRGRSEAADEDGGTPSRRIRTSPPSPRPTAAAAAAGGLAGASGWMWIDGLEPMTGKHCPCASKRKGTEMYRYNCWRHGPESFCIKRETPTATGGWITCATRAGTPKQRVACPVHGPRGCRGPGDGVPCPDPKMATFAPAVGQSPIACAGCARGKDPPWIDVVSHPRRCHCSTRASFGYPGQPPTACAKHQKTGMRDVCNHKCSACGVTQINNDKFNGECFRCWRRTATEAEVEAMNVRERVREDSFTARVTPWVATKLGTELRQQVTFGSNRRVDFVIVRPGHPILVIEVDEHQHARNRMRYEERENAGHPTGPSRTDMIFNELPKRLLPDPADRHPTTPLVLMRFNPDSYRRDDGVRVRSAFKDNQLVDEAELTRRLAVLFETLRKAWDADIAADTTVIRLFFDGSDA